jgi:hypothetical protein
MSLTSLTKPYHTVTGKADCRALPTLVGKATELLLRTMINKRPELVTWTAQLHLSAPVQADTGAFRSQPKSVIFSGNPDDLVAKNHRCHGSDRR